MNKIKYNKLSIKIFSLLFLCIISLFIVSGCKKKEQEKVVPTSITTNLNEVNLYIGDSINITYEVLPSDAEYTIIWASKDSNIATVKDGKITGIAEGSTTITVGCVEYSNVSKDIKVTVSKKIISHTITYNLDGGINPSDAPTDYIEGGEYTLPIPTKEGYNFLGWFIEDKVVEVIDSSYKSDITLNAKWELVVTEITINEIEDLYVGKTFQLSSNVPNNLVSYSSSDESIATISEDGVITCISKGNIIITATYINDQTITTYTNVKVYGIPEVLKTINKTTELFVDQKTTFKLTATPSNSYTKVIWESSDESIATVDEKGAVIGISAGVVTIKATSVINPDVTFERTITVKEPAKSVEINSIISSAYIGEQITLTATVLPSTVSNEVTWQSSDESIATVDENGVVTIISRGVVTITASSKVTSSVKGKITITGLHQLLTEENSDVKYIICAPGTDASTSICINYHAKNTLTYIEYTKNCDPNFDQALTYIPEGIFFEELSEELDGPFEARNIFSAEITGLTPGTKYLYRINNGDGTYSETYSFVTAEGAGNDFSFIWLTDNHYHYLQQEETTGPEISEETIKKAIEMRPDLAFVFDTGDMIDTGGNANIWNLMFQKRETLKYLPLVSTTGNHELYIASTGQWDNRFHAAYNALPKNGVEGKVGTSCYYYYNDVLFITIENMSASSYDLQYEWMENLLKEARYEKKAKMVIVGMHGPIQTETGADRDTKMMALFEKYSVDLVLTGHYHTDNEERNYWRGDNSSNDLLGVNYLIGLSAGAKGVGNNDPKEFAKGYIVDVIGTTIKVTLIDANGKVYSERVFESKKYEEVSDEAKNTSKETIMDSFTYKLDTNSGVATFKWTSLAYGNVDKIIFEEVNRKEFATEVIIINKAFTDALVGNIINNQDSKIKISVYFNDGTLLTKEITISRNTNYNLQASKNNDSSIILSMDELSNSISNIVKEFNIYIDGVLFKTLTYNSINNPINNFVIEDIDTSINHNIKVVAVNNDKVIFENSYNYQAN